jgi:hypothetical protein
MIEYVLTGNPLTKEEPNDRYARIVNTRTFTEEDVAKEIAESNVGISEGEAMSMLITRANIILKRLARGERANLRLENIHFGIPGAFKAGEFPTKAVARITPSKEVNAAVESNPLRSLEAYNQLVIHYVEDVLSGTTDEYITRGGSVKIYGHNLKIVEKLPDPPVFPTPPPCRVEFISVEDPDSVYPVAAINIVDNDPTRLLIIAPDLVIGDYVWLKVTTQYGGHSKPLITPRSITFDKPFLVKAKSAGESEQAPE